MPAAEVEVKFYVRALAQLQARIAASGGKLLRPRVLETNLRFDTPDRSLQAKGCALRLRQDAGALLTYKGMSETVDGIRSRTELEVLIGDMARGRELLEALGYIVSFVYEKYRTVYSLGNVEVMLDELPFGDFVEIEGAAGELKPAAAELGLIWEAAIAESYMGLFTRVQQALGLPFNDLTFRNFEGIRVDPTSLSVRAADNPQLQT